ncbi:MAG: alpha-L-arabinofuranosidase [Sphingobacteriales bacterium]|nr:MAG: alpha-L-arabinofuranosidase [Sphingobacteriales bacterium]
MNAARIKSAVIICLFFLSGIKINAQQNQIVVNAGQIKSDIQPTMWGVFFEDINLGADGGIYAELVKNRSFEFTKAMMGWKILGKPKTEGDFLVINRHEESTNNPRFLRTTLHNAAERTIGLSNEGFRGMGIKKDLRYDFSALVRRKSGSIKLLIELANSKDEVIGKTTLTVNATGGEWKKVTASFTATTTELKAKFNIWMEGDGETDFDMISLFPTDTWKGRPGGMRADMIQLLADMKPGFIRFPGGCIVEGFELTGRYQWKKTIGAIEERQLIINRWNTEFAHRLTPDYFQTFGLGFYEYFQLAEDIGAAPLPILNCGMACQFNSAEVVPLNQLDPYVQDALDLIEFANGDAATQWGKVRTNLGHPKPFNLKMMGVGNENWGPQYMERLQLFVKAIKAKYPDFKIISSSGTDPNGERFDYLNGELRKMNADIIDEHYYRRPEWFLQNASRYDNYDRNGPKIFGGEYAAQSDKTVSVDNKNNWQTALAEAAFMTGMERNAGVVHMASYAPLFAHIDGWQWTPDLIWVNNLMSYGTPNYHVQKLFAVNKGTHVVSILSNGAIIAGKDSLYASAAIDKTTGELILKFVNASATEITRSVAVEGIKKTPTLAKQIALSNQLNKVNSFDKPFEVAPVETDIAVKNKKLNLQLQPYSFTVIKIKM